MRSSAAPFLDGEGEDVDDREGHADTEGAVRRLGGVTEELPEDVELFGELFGDAGEGNMALVVAPAAPEQGAAKVRATLGAIMAKAAPPAPAVVVGGSAGQAPGEATAGRPTSI